MNGSNGGGRRYYGKYRGTVVSNVDPQQQGRITATVPDVLGAVPTTWATACVPVTGIQSGSFVLPPPGANVWIEFEGGNPNYPIWSGCYWGGPSDVPALALAGAPPAPNILLQTVTQNGLLISGNPATGIMLKLASGAGIIINEAGIVIQNGKGATITMTGNTVSINPPALVVT
jgi:Type VI secretion system/phage-baseplate injector OB domain